MTTEITDVQQGDGAMSTDLCVLAEQLMATAPSQGVELTVRVAC
jgi:hypothetical protein